MACDLGQVEIGQNGGDLLLVIGNSGCVLSRKVEFFVNEYKIGFGYLDYDFGLSC